MILSMSNQAVVFLTTVIVGALIGFIFDLFRILRMIISHKKNAFWIQLEDLVFWVFVSGLMFFVMFNQNYGEIRVYLIIGAFLGMLIYFCSVSRLFMAASAAIIAFVKKVLRVVFRIVSAPFIWMYGVLKIPFRLIANFFSKIILKFKKILRKSKKYAKMKSRQTVGQFRIITKKI